MRLIINKSIPKQIHTNPVMYKESELYIPISIYRDGTEMCTEAELYKQSHKLAEYNALVYKHCSISTYLYKHRGIQIQSEADVSIKPLFTDIELCETTSRVYSMASKIHTWVLCA